MMPVNDWAWFLAVQVLHATNNPMSNQANPMSEKPAVLRLTKEMRLGATLQ